MTDISVLPKLFKTIEARRKASPTKSYTAKLFAGGREKIARKIHEEAGETVIELMKGNKKKLAQESGDLIYHLLVAWAHAGIAPADVWAVLEDRTVMSGVQEKKGRKKKRK